jgi:hypothetical protein
MGRQEPNLMFMGGTANGTIVCYISDRSLSARIGRGFWSRGPVALTGVRNGRRTFDDFPPLQPQGEDETDYASILQANLDLVQLFSNVHDVLYSGMGNSMRLMLAGNYVKYVDDFRSAIVGWKSNWLTLTCKFTEIHSNSRWLIAEQALQISRQRSRCLMNISDYTPMPMPSRPQYRGPLPQGGYPA